MQQSTSSRVHLTPNSENADANRFLSKVSRESYPNLKRCRSESMNLVQEKLANDRKRLVGIMDQFMLPYTLVTLIE
ncbi:Hypothetical predicted protein [Octopus vulgaris]|uniref:Uncharacterized protein n=1 Tax=Octopus vulgaris TaxID=6645 RepID=A0AA36B0F5_OCTVU|nr:Hypothetical predicted protein [Octopus vulgaris]